jgi:hypothetical protein
MTNVKIDRGIAFDGAAIEQAGIGNYALLINKEDLDNGAVVIDNVTKEITTVTLANGMVAYKFESSKGATQITPSTKLKLIAAIDGFEHQLEIIGLDISQLSRENIVKMRFQKIVAIIPLATGKAMMYGQNVGMRIQDFVETPGDADKGGTIQFTLKTPDNDPPEINAPCVIADTFDITSLL